MTGSRDDVILIYNYHYYIIAVRSANTNTSPPWRVPACLSESCGGDEWEPVSFNGSAGLTQPSVVRVRPGEPTLRAFFRDQDQFRYAGTRTLQPVAGRALMKQGARGFYPP
jgi:hypothetical protein